LNSEAPSFGRGPLACSGLVLARRLLPSFLAASSAVAGTTRWLLLAGQVLVGRYWLAVLVHLLVFEVTGEGLVWGRLVFGKTLVWGWVIAHDQTLRQAGLPVRQAGIEPATDGL
jgi:hypothetical protein